MFITRTVDIDYVLFGDGNSFEPTPSSFTAPALMRRRHGHRRPQP
jgi:hypothetical protein